MELLGERLAEHGANLDAAMHRFLTDLREFDRGDGWVFQSAQTCVHWLSWRLGMDRSTAREHLRVAHRLADLPLIDDALRRGTVSYSKVRAMTRVASAATEPQLVEMARLMTASQLEAACRKFRASTPQRPANPNDDLEQRFVSRRDRDDGMVQITAMLRPDEAARLWTVLDAIARERVSAEARFDRADALMELVEARARGDRPDRAPVELVVTVSAQALAQDSNTDALDRAAVTADGSVLTIATARRLACDASVVIVAEDSAGNPLAVGRRHRTVTTALRRALAVRDPACRFPGCTNRVFLEAHHVHHWVDGGATEIDNLVHLCTLHHDLLHEHDFRIEDGQFYDRDGRPIAIAPRQPRRSDLGWPAIRAANVGLDITAETNACLWDGRPVDYGEVIDDLWRAEDRASAEP